MKNQMKLGCYAAVLAMGCVAWAQSPELALYDTEPVTKFAGGQIVPAEVRTAFKEFQSSAEYYGAFAVSKDGAVGYFSGAHSIANAETVAMAMCRSKADNSKSCKIYATLIPEGFDPKEARPTVNQGLTKALTTEVAQSGEKYSNISIYTNELGSYGWAASSFSKTIAGHNAKRSCSSAYKEKIADFGKDEVSAINKSGLSKSCVEFEISSE